MAADDAAFRVLGQDRDALRAVVRGVTVEVLRVPERGYNPGTARILEEPTVIDGLAVASLPDLLASKLDLLLYRQKLRDYIDLVAIDAQSAYSLEDGLLFHEARYGDTPGSSELSRIVRLLEVPGPLASDGVFEARRAETLDYLRARAPALRRFLHHQVLAVEADAEGPPQDRPDTAGPTARLEQAVTYPPDGLDMEGSDGAD